MKLNNRTRILEKDTNIYVPDIADLVWMVKNVINAAGIIIKYGWFLLHIV